MTKVDITDKITRALQKIRAAHDGALADLNITGRQLVVLRYFADNNNAIQRDAVVQTGINKSTLSQLINNLHERRFIARRKSKDDRRANCIVATQKGLDAVKRGGEIIASEDKKLFDGMPEQHQRTLANLLDRIIGSSELAEAAE